MCWKNVPISLRGVERRGRSVLRRLFITFGLVAVTCAAAGMQQLSGRVVAGSIRMLDDTRNVSTDGANTMSHAVADVEYAPTIN